MPRLSTRKQQREQGPGKSSASSSRRADDAAESSSSDEMPVAVLRSKHGSAIKDLFRGLVGMIDASSLPLFKENFGSDALKDFASWLRDVFHADEGIESDDTESDGSASFVPGSDEGSDDESCSECVDSDEETEEEEEETEEDDEYEDDDEIDEAAAEAARRAEKKRRASLSASSSGKRRRKDE